MRFTFIALAASLSSGLRPEVSVRARSGSTARIADILSKVSRKDSLATLKTSTDAVSGILAEMGNATEHMSEADEDVLHFAITTFETMIYGSLNDCHEDNLADLDAAISAISQCNHDINLRQSKTGDLGKLEIAVSLKQIELNRLQTVVDEKTEINNTRWEDFDSHMQLIAKPPACPGLPTRSMPALDLYFEESLYVIWFAAQQSAYIVVRDAWVLASANLESAIEAYDIQLAVRDTQYCDWKTELEAACAAFDVCYSDTTDSYTSLVASVTNQMDERITIKKSGDIIIHQLKFLLGEVEDQESPPTDTSEYEIAFETAPPKGLCDLSPLDADRWVPTPLCGSPFCLRIITGQGTHNDGTLSVSVSTGVSVLEVVAADAGVFQRGSTVLDTCYPDPINYVDVTSPSNNAWAGEILYANAVDNFQALSCPTCTGNGDSSSIVVDGDSNGGTLAPLTCLSSKTCRLFEKGPYCLRIVTGSGTHHDGTLSANVIFSNAAAALDVAGGQLYSRGSTVSDACYTNPISYVDVRSPTTNAWAGSVLYATDGVNFNALPCPSCSGNGDSAGIVVDGDSNGNTLASLHCLASRTCRLG